ncbi:MAG: sigma-70 family RNA polymerase sigma factor [Nitrospinota bacterium]|nr:sigma-70 family RNA polymerase sigma factor [Nitrospinota bacterium]
MPQEEDHPDQDKNDWQEPDPFEPGSASIPLQEPEHEYGQLVPVDPLQQYIRRIRQYPQLSHEEETELAELYLKTGDREAAFRLVTANLMLVVKIAFEFRTQFQNMLDLIQEGNYGLMRAVQKFDPFKGARLSTYAAYWVRAYMLKHLLDNWRLVKVGTTNMRRKLLYRLRDMEEKLSAAGEPVTTKLLAEHFGATEEDVIEVQKSIGALDKSIYQPVEEGSSRQVVDTLAGSEVDFAHALGESQALEMLREAVERLKPALRPVERSLLEKRIMANEPVTLREIGEEYGVTREAIRQTEERLMKKLKEYLKKELGVEGEITTPPED